MFYVKIYNRHHELLDEIHEIGNLEYTPSLNNYGTCQFSINIFSNKNTREMIMEENHVELFENDKCIWWGVLSDIEYSNSQVNIGCYGYLYLLKDVIYEGRKEYKRMKCSALIMNILQDCNTIHPTGIEVGEIYGESSAVDTERIIDQHRILDKITDYIEQYGYSIRVDRDRKLNFYSNYGKDKSSYLEIIYDPNNTQYSNVVKEPSVVRTSSEMANRIVGISSFTEETATYGDVNTFVETGEKTITVTLEDTDSINMYGRRQEILKFNDIKLENTLRERVLAELNKRSKPLLNISLSIIDSGVCPIEDIDVGDEVMLRLPMYGIEEKIKILEIKRNVFTNTIDLTLGDMMWLNKSIETKIY